MSQNPFSEFQPPNPYQSSGVGGMHGPSGDASGKVGTPATLLMAAGIIGLLAHVLGVAANLAGIGNAGAAPPQGMDPQTFQSFMLAGTIGGGVIGIALDVLVIYGAIQMKQLRNYGFSMAAAIVAMLPCISCGCLLGLPVGIWSLVVLNKNEVKSAFR